MSRRVEIAPSRDQKQAGLTDIELCAMHYRFAIDHGADELKVVDYTGRGRVYTLAEVETFMREHPGYKKLIVARDLIDPDPSIRYRNKRFQQRRGRLFVPA